MDIDNNINEAAKAADEKLRAEHPEIDWEEIDRVSAERRERSA